VPFGVVIATLPDAPEPTRALITDELATIKELAGTPPKVTDVAPEKLDPLICTVIPVPAIMGVKLVIVGGGK
jgi:hypothetical protein